MTGTTIEVERTMAEAFKSKINVDMIDAIKSSSTGKYWIKFNCKGSRINSCTYLSSVQDNGCR